MQVFGTFFLHFFLRMSEIFRTTFNTAVRSLWQGAKKLGRAYSSFINPESDSGLFFLCLLPCDRLFVPLRLI